jgi:hypothetical protein
MRDSWREAMGLIRLTPENRLKRYCGGRNQAYRAKRPPTQQGMLGSREKRLVKRM